MRALPLPTIHILLAVADRERHGYAIMLDVLARTDGTLRLGPGTLYGSIKRLLADGLIEELDERPDRSEGPGGRGPRSGDDIRRRYYKITRAGRKAAADETARFAALVRHARAMGLAPKTV